jgi:hypothetical protein
MMKPIALALAISMMLAPQFASAQSQTNSSHGSSTLSAGSAQVVAGSLETISGSAEFIVAAIEAIGDSAVVTLTRLSEAGGESVKLSVELAGGASLAVGKVIQAVATSTGYALMSAGQILAFVPNEVGRSLLYHKRHADRR